MRSQIFPFMMFVMSLLSCRVVTAEHEKWVDLFDGKTLDGWVQKNGTATYRVEDGAIVGKTTEGSPNSFLCTQQDYGDFELEFEVRVADELNSGVQIRSKTKEGKPKGRVNGPQCEIEASGAKGAEAGYIYGEATGRGWLTPPERLKPHKVMKDGEWNRFRILATGPRIQTWINGEKIEDLTDDAIYQTHPRGFIGLQVHGIKKGTGPYEVAWRNIRIRVLESDKLSKNRLTPEETKQGFALLFDGETFNGWKQSGNWGIVDGVIARQGKGGSLVYTESKIPDDFELRFEWKVAPGSNSGVYYRPGQYEYQILDNSRHPDGKNPRTSAASLYFCMAPSRDVTLTPGEWNQGRIVCQGTVIQHWLNGHKVIDFDYADEQWAWNVELLRKRGGDLAARGGNLFLQDHGDPVWYRNIRLRTIPEGEKIAHSTVQPAEIPDDVKKAEAAKLKRILENRRQSQKKQQK